VKTELTRFRRETVTSLAGGALASRIMQVRSDADGALMVLAENGMRRLGRGGEHRDVVFETRMFRHEVIPLAGGRSGIGGFSSRPNAVVILDFEGRELLRVSTGSDYEFPVFADVTGSSDVELLVPHDRGIRVLSVEGNPLAAVASPRYMNIKTVVQADADAQYEIALVDASLREGPIDVMILNADGSVISEWSDDDGGWLSFVPDADDTALWGITSEGFTAWNAQGKRVTTFPAPGADYLRFVIGTKFKGHTALIGSGGGYSNMSLLCVFDDERRLVYQEVFPSRTYAISADPNGSDFLVGLGYDVVRYSLVDPALSHGGDR
jgi:hypothetical protein